MLEKIDLNNLDKSNWESFRFEEITNRVAEGVDPHPPPGQVNMLWVVVCFVFVSMGRNR